MVSCRESAAALSRSRARAGLGLRWGAPAGAGRV